MFSRALRSLDFALSVGCLLAGMIFLAAFSVGGFLIDGVMALVLFVLSFICARLFLGKL